MKHNNLKMPTKIAIYIRFGSETFSCILPDEAENFANTMPNIGVALRLKNR